jgi:hypothetical protein
MKIKGIGLTSGTSWITIAETAMTDQNGLPVVARVDGTDALSVSTFAADAISPLLEAFTLDLTAGVLVLSFSETVEPRTVSVAALALSDAAGSTTYRLTAASSSAVAGRHPVISIAIGELDLNEIKVRPTLGISTTSTVLSLDSALVSDLNNNSVVPEAAQIAAVFIADAIAPTLRAWTLDMNTTIAETQSVQVASARITFSFDEVVHFASHNGSEVSLQGLRTGTSAGVVTLHGFFESISSANSTQLLFKLLRLDTNALKLLESVATDQSNTFLTIGSGFVTDVNSNPVNAVASTDATPVTQFTDDGRKPEILNFTIDINAGTISISFDEITRGREFRASEITIRDTSNPATQTANLTLTGAIVAGSLWNPITSVTFPHPNSDVITFEFVTDDLNEIKRLNMCTTDTDCYVVHTEFLVPDMVLDDVGRTVNQIRRCE